MSTQRPDILRMWLKDAVVKMLAGITYDRDSKQHTCVIEKMIKE